MLDHPKLDELDRKRIKDCIEEFKNEMRKVTGSENMGQIVERRVVKIEDGNPSDGQWYVGG